MLKRNGALAWHERTLASSVHRESRTVDGKVISIWAYPRGIPPRHWHVSFTPVVYDIVKDAFAYLRFRVRFRGAWVVEIREHSFDRIVVDGLFPTRASAMDRVDAMRGLVSTLSLAEIGAGALQAPERVP